MRKSLIKLPIERHCDDLHVVLYVLVLLVGQLVTWWAVFLIVDGQFRYGEIERFRNLLDAHGELLQTVLEYCFFLLLFALQPHESLILF